jgi:hypothetical protein
MWTNFTSGTRNKWVTTELTDDERRILWEQYVDTYVESQRTYDSSVRTLAAAGVAVTVSLATALDQFGTPGKRAAAFFLASLLFNLISYATAQRDMSGRLDSLSRRDDEGALEGNRWTKLTHVLNFLAGAALIAAGVYLSKFVAKAT